MLLPLVMAMWWGRGSVVVCAICGDHCQPFPCTPSQQAGVEVMVVTPGPGMTLPGVDFSAACNQPADFHGARIVQAFSFGLPWYLSLPLSFGLSPRIYREVK